MSWRGTDLAENEAKQRAADMNVMFDQYGERDQQERRVVQPPIAVESAKWSAVGELDYWVMERHEWWGRVRGPDGHPVLDQRFRSSPCQSRRRAVMPGPATSPFMLYVSRL
jgi:hypothetical protein